jgi:hypothetical protein
VRALCAALALAFAGCVASVEPPTFSVTDAGRIAVPVDRTLTLTGTLSLPVV